MPPDATGKAVIPEIEPPVIATPLAFCVLIVPSPDETDVTNAVVASCVVLVPGAAVGAGEPVEPLVSGHLHADECHPRLGDVDPISAGGDSAEGLALAVDGVLILAVRSLSSRTIHCCPGLKGIGEPSVIVKVVPESASGRSQLTSHERPSRRMVAFPRPTVSACGVLPPPLSK